MKTPSATKPTDLRGVVLRQLPAPRLRQAAKGAILVRQGDFADYSLLLLDGWLALSKVLPDGAEQIIDVMLPGDFALIGARVAPVAACSAEALSDVRYVLIGPDELNGASAAAAELRQILAAKIVTAQARIAELMLRIGKSSAAGRIAYALLEFFVRLEVVGMTRGTSFALPMTQQKLGEVVGLSNVHVCRTLRRFERNGLISHPDPARIRLDDIDGLCAIARIELDDFRDEILIGRIAARGDIHRRSTISPRV